MLADRYIRTDLTSQEDFEKNFILNVPEHFHFAYDVVDEYARISPDKRALIWCDLKGHERTVTFGDISRMSNREMCIRDSFDMVQNASYLILYLYDAAAKALQPLALSLIHI